MSDVSKKHGEMSFLKAAFIQAVSKYSTVIMQMAITVVLARLLTPEQYGVMAGVTVFTSFFSILADLGLGPAIIQYQISIQGIMDLFLSFHVVLAFVFPVSSSFWGHH